MSPEANPKTEVTVQLLKFAHALNRETASKGMTSPKLALAAAVLAFSQLGGEEKVSWLNQARALSFNS